MAVRTLSRWQKASAIVPMAVLVVAWGAAVANSGLATADDGIEAAEIPDVPTTALEQPASVQETPAGIDPKAGADGAVSTLSTNGIPSSALSAYRRAETLLGKADEACNLPWHLVAAIGRVESNHGRFGGSTLNSDGTAEPGIYGIALDGTNGTARITDTDNGALDKDRVYDRAVGPMQFIPSTWKAVGVDADGDGEKDPQNIYDAATAAGIYLCSGDGNLSDGDDVATAVKRYNRSDSYVDLVMKISEAYADGDFSQTPNGTPPGNVITSQSHDQTLSQGQRERAQASERKAEKKEAAAKKRAAERKKQQQQQSSGGSGSTSGGGTSTGGSGGGTSGGGGSTGGDTASGGSSGSKSTLGGTIKKSGSGSAVEPVTGAVGTVLSWTEANLRCLGIEGVLGGKSYSKCMNEFGY
ncbi:lytic transglycosylase domain-containing protein [Aeromicrobium sp. CTD01-1L150]|uniref:lytic transglycosylase domain-containing protein n=1 Tax=Aeromicrobium sp. CTD01-1L150 TaxID=3341830 RepID=UPI0035C2147B